MNDVPVAAGQSVATNEDSAKVVTLSATDVETCELTFSIVTGPTHQLLGTISGNDCIAGSPNMDTASITYAPAANYSGPTRSPSRRTTARRTAGRHRMITVSSVNDAPAADAQAVSATEDVRRDDLSDRLSTPDGDALTFSIVTGPSHGTLGLIRHGWVLRSAVQLLGQCHVHAGRQLQRLGLVQLQGQ